MNQNELDNINNWTKTELAQVIVQALHNASEPPPPDHFKVKRMVRRHTKSFLVSTCDMALSAMKQEETSCVRNT